MTILPDQSEQRVFKKRGKNIYSHTCFEPERGVVDNRSWMRRSVSDLKKWSFFSRPFGWGNGCSR